MKPCGLCGKPATGMATINDVRYCHGDDDAEPTCYERGQRLRCPTAAVIEAADEAEESQ